MTHSQIRQKTSKKVRPCHFSCWLTCKIGVMWQLRVTAIGKWKSCIIALCAVALSECHQIAIMNCLFNNHPHMSACAYEEKKFAHKIFLFFRHFTALQTLVPFHMWCSVVLVRWQCYCDCFFFHVRKCHSVCIVVVMQFASFSRSRQCLWNT